MQKSQKDAWAFLKSITFDIILFSILMNNIAIKKSINDHITRSSPSQMFEKISVLKNFAKFTKNTRARVLFSIKLEAKKFLKIPKKAPVALSRI